MAGLGKWLTIAVIGVLVVSGGAIVIQGGGFTDGETGNEYDTATITATDFRTGDELATIDVRIADNQKKRVTGLSDTASLGEDEGMLFVHDSEGTYNYVMRDMAFSIDIVFINADGEVTTIHHAEQTDESSFEGTGKYVLEVPYEYTDENDITGGDIIEIPEEYQ